MTEGDLQIDEHGRLKHFLSIEGLSKKILIDILTTAEKFIGVGERAVKKVPLLRGKTIVNLFFEPSTRTRSTFELAVKRLSADLLNINISTSATKKGESLLDTLRTLEAMQCDMFVVRHNNSGAAHFIAAHVAPHIRVINAGDGRHAHPTQAMLDMFTIRRVKGGFSDLKVAIIGDIAHSRVARSDIHALNILGAGEIRVVGPKTLIPPRIESMGVEVFHRPEQGLADVDVIIMLRLQEERMQGPLLPSAAEFFRMYGLTTARLARAKPDAIVLHPGPINRGVEIASEVADSGQSVILQQVSYGIATRMAIMSMCMSGVMEARSSGR